MSWGSGKDKENAKKNNLYFLSGTIVILIVFFIIFAPTRTFQYEVEVYYTAVETFTEKEPYETNEAYEVQEPYEDVEYFTDTVPVELSVPYTDYEFVVYDAPAGEYYPSWGSDCSCTNYDFWGDCIQLTCQVAITRYRTEIVYEKIQKERPITRYLTVTKYRTVTKYGDVQKTRNVIKTKMEPREIEVNWLFGFKVPYKLQVPYISE